MVAPKRRATSADVAKVVGVSRATVGFVLNDTPGQTISEATRRRVVSAALQLGYRPNNAARALARGRSDIVLLVLPDWPMDGSLVSFITELTAALDAAGYSLVTWTPRADAQARPLWASLDADLVMGLATFQDDELAALRASGVDHVFPRPDDLVGVDAHRLDAGHRLAVDHLYDLGHRRIAFAGHADRRYAAVERHRVTTVATRAAMHGMTLFETRTVDHADGSAEHAVLEWRAAGCTGVVAYNDEAAATVVRAAAGLGVAVPAQLSVVGHDDSPLAALFVPGLTSVRLDYPAIAAEVAAQALRELGARPPATASEPVAVVVARESTGPLG